MQQLPPGAAQPAVTKTNEMAIISLASGIASWFVLPLVGGVVAVVTGHIARGQIRQTGEQGAGLALGGLILGYLHLAVAALVVILLILLFVGILGAVLAVHPTPSPLPTG